MKKIVWNIFVILYAGIAIFTTICLLSYNEYRVTELGSYSLIIVDSRDLEPNYNKGDLIIADKSYKLEIGDEVFFYNTYNPNVEINVAKITEKQGTSESDATYTVEGNKTIKAENVLGPTDKAKKISKLGGILSVIESKWGFLILIVFPSLIAFLYEITELVSDLKDKKRKE